MRSIVSYTPHRLGLFDDIDRVFQSLSHDLSLMGCNGPRVDIRAEGERYVLEAELPGLEERDIEVKVEENLLTISSDHEQKSEAKENGYLLKERRSASFCRSFVLPEDVERDKIGASFKDGLLTLDMPKMERAKPKTIDVKKG